MSSGSMQMAKVTGTATNHWGAENAATKASQQTFGNIQLNSRKVKAVVAISKHLITGAGTAGINAEQIILNDIVTAFAPEIEAQILRGSGVSSTLLGVYNRMAPGNKFNTAGTSLDNVTTDIKRAISKLRSTNVPLTSGQWVMSSRSENHLRFLRNTTNGFLEMAAEINTGKLFGYDLGVSNYIPDDITSNYSEVYLLDLDAMVLGVERPLTIEMSDTAAYYDSAGTVQSAWIQDQVIIQVSMTMDFGMFYPTAAACVEQVVWGA